MPSDPSYSAARTVLSTESNTPGNQQWWLTAPATDYWIERYLQFINDMLIQGYRWNPKQDIDTSDLEKSYERWVSTMFSPRETPQPFRFAQTSDWIIAGARLLAAGKAPLPKPTPKLTTYTFDRVWPLNTLVQRTDGSYKGKIVGYWWPVNALDPGYVVQSASTVVNFTRENVVPQS